MLLLDDHLVRGMILRTAAGDFTDFAGDFATTNLWLFRLARSIARLEDATDHNPKESGAENNQTARQRLDTLATQLVIVPMSSLLWLMADLQAVHRAAGRPLSTAMVEALAAAHHLGAEIAVAAADIGPSLQASADADGITFHVID